VDQVQRRIGSVVRLGGKRGSALLGYDAGVAALLLFDCRQSGHHVLATVLAQCIVAYVAVMSMPTLIFPCIMPYSKADSARNIDLQYIQTILTPTNLDEEPLSAIPDSENPCLNPYCAPPFIQLTQRDDVVLESRNVQHVDELDLLPCLAEECRNAPAFNWDDRPVTKPHGPLHRAVKQ
jgi:hypothetical protein